MRTLGTSFIAGGATVVVATPCLCTVPQYCSVLCALCLVAVSHSKIHRILTDTHQEKSSCPQEKVQEALGCDELWRHSEMGGHFVWVWGLSVL